VQCTKRWQNPKTSQHELDPETGETQAQSFAQLKT